MKQLENKVAVVTGASKGIGAGIAKQLGAAGAAVVVNYASDREGAGRVVSEIVAGGGRAVAVQADVADEQQVSALFAAVRAEYGHVDVLVNNAGVYSMSPVAEFTVEQFRRIYDTNVLGVLLATRAALPLFPASGGSIVNIGSIVSTMAPPGASLYSASKGAVDTITKSLAKELGARSIRVNAVSPGLTATEGYHSAGFAASDFEKQGVAMTPLGRVGTPEDIALPVVYLASDAARWVTGDILYASGGAAI